MFEQILICYVCRQTVDTSTACTDGRGKAVHSDCYAKVIADSSYIPGATAACDHHPDAALKRRSTARVIGFNNYETA